MSARRRAKMDVDLDAMVASGPTGAYEALQLYRSRSNRFKSKNDVMGAIQAAAHGAKCLLTHTYVNAGAELAALAVELLNEGHLEINPALRNLMFEIDSTFPEADAARVEFLKSCVKWTIATGLRELGDPAMHLRLGECLWLINDKHAIYHYAVSEEPEKLAQAIDTSFGGADQVLIRDQKVTLAILQFLALENMRDANELFKVYKKTKKAKGAHSDLVTFCDYLLQTAKRDAAPLFKTLVNAYAPHLDFDESAGSLLMGPIAQKLFNIPPKANPMMSMLQNLLS